MYHNCEAINGQQEQLGEIMDSLKITRQVNEENGNLSRQQESSWLHAFQMEAPS